MDLKELSKNREKSQLVYSVFWPSSELNIYQIRRSDATLLRKGPSVFLGYDIVTYEERNPHLTLLPKLQYSLNLLRDIKWENKSSKLILYIFRATGSTRFSSKVLHWRISIQSYSNKFRLLPLAFIREYAQSSC